MRARSRLRGLSAPTTVLTAGAMFSPAISHAGSTVPLMIESASVTPTASGDAVFFRITFDRAIDLWAASAAPAYGPDTETTFRIGHRTFSTVIPGEPLPRPSVDSFQILLDTGQPTAATPSDFRLGDAATAAPEASFADGFGPTWDVVVRGDEIASGGHVVFRAANGPPSDDPAAGGWSDELGMSTVWVDGDTIEFFAASEWLGYAECQPITYEVSATVDAAVTDVFVPVPAAAVGGLALMGLLSLRRRS